MTTKRSLVATDAAFSTCNAGRSVHLQSQHCCVIAYKEGKVEPAGEVPAVIDRQRKEIRFPRAHGLTGIADFQELEHNGELEVLPAALPSGGDRYDDEE